jgi:hypothetical protein
MFLLDVGHLELLQGIGWFKMIVEKYGNYEQKFIWQLCV